MANVLFSHFGEAPVRGSERVLLMLMEGLKAHGHDIHLLCNQSSLAAAARPHCTSIHRFPQHPHRARGVRPWVEYASNVRLAASLIRSHKIEIVVANNLGTTHWLCPATLLRRIPLISYIHANYLPGSRATSLAYASDRIVGVSEFVLQGFKDDKYPHNRLVKIWNGIRAMSPKTSREEVRERLGLSGDAVIALCVGAVIPLKRMDVFAEAAGALSSKNPQFYGLIAGDGMLLDDLQRRFSSNHVRFLGWRQDLEDLINASDFIVSCSEREAFGLTIAEAASLQKPAVVASAGGQSEIVLDGVTGLHFTLNSVKECAARMELLTNQAALRARLGEEAYKNYLKQFEQSKMINEIELVMHDVIRNSTTGNPTARRIIQLVRCSLHAIASRIKRAIKNA